MIRAAVEAGLLIAAIGLAYAAWGWANGWLCNCALLHESFEGYYLPVVPPEIQAIGIVLTALAASRLGKKAPQKGQSHFVATRRAGRPSDTPGEAAGNARAALSPRPRSGYLSIILARCKNLHYRR